MNPGPLACQASALTNWATPPYILEATPGIEPGIRVLQTLALPLGHVATFPLERKTGFEPATLALARRCSTAELLPLGWCRRPESNWRHADFQSAALPTELPRRTRAISCVLSGYSMAEAMGFEPTVSCVTGTYVRPATPRLRVSLVGETGIEPVTLCV